MSGPSETGPWSKVRFVVTGRVQGVGFRYHVARAAEAAGDLGGFVRNLLDGRVEGCLESTDGQAIEHAMAAIRRGPVGSRVDDMDIERTACVTPEFSGFTIRETGPIDHP